MSQADIVVSSTGCPQTILHRAEVAELMPQRRNRPLFLIDIAVPRDIDAEVQDVPNVYLYNVDHLEAIVRENVRLREHELTECRAIIAEHAQEIMARFQPPAPKNFVPIPSRQPEWAMAGAAVCQS
jgi:glutamyl-tRNA reductase